MTSPSRVGLEHISRPSRTPLEYVDVVELVTTENAWRLGTVVLVAATVWLTLRLRDAWHRRARVRRAARAQRAERDAAGVLKAYGFRVLGRQVRQSWALQVDGEEVRFTLIADYLVSRDGQRWVAEVKTGERSLDLRHGPTRRQLLEYREAFEVEGVLLVDAEDRALRSVSFPESRTRPARAAGIVQLAAAAMLGWVLAAYWLS